MTRSGAILVSVAALTLTATATAQAAPSAPNVHRAVLDGDLGVVGGPYPGGFHPTPGTVEVVGKTIAMQAIVGRSGEFHLQLPPGIYTVSGCGPTAGSAPMCSPSKTIRLHVGQFDHLELVWAQVP
jgi:hypothetical protein